MQDKQLKFGFMHSGVLIENGGMWNSCVNTWATAIVELSFEWLNLDCEHLKAQVFSQLREMLSSQTMCSCPLVASVAYVHCPKREEFSCQIYLSEIDGSSGYIIPLAISRPALERRWRYRVESWFRRILRLSALERGVRMSTRAALRVPAISPAALPELSEDEEELARQAGLEQSESLSMNLADDIVMIFVAAMFVELRRLGAIKDERFMRTLRQVPTVLKDVDVDDLTPDKLGWIAKKLSKIADEQGAANDGE